MSVILNCIAKVKILLAVSVMKVFKSIFCLQISSILKEAGVHSTTVQVEKESYFFHMSGLGSSMDNSMPISYTPSKVKFTRITSAASVI